eukprot:TRINITY_DN2564_c0_g1_i1.p1 TRINITY_DN2564_c0_g1~~TRINITY_DN2564_c0_g1_i1.p1  ORF type:complete len:458 (-),score=80.18 TRINITY_DN2564_c0_g1_i1:530-1903(-)
MEHPVEAKIQILERARAKAAQIELLISDLSKEILDEFQVKLDTNASEVRQKIECLQSFYALLKNSHVTVHSVKSGFFSLLPAELVHHIFSFLSPHALCNVSGVNWEFKKNSEDPRLWKNLCDVCDCEVFWERSALEPDSAPKEERGHAYWKEVFRWYHECDKKVDFDSTGLHSPNQSSPETARGEDSTEINEPSGVPDDSHEKCRGKASYLDGSIYRGEWVIDSNGLGKRNGKGIQRWAEKDIYKGEWKKDKRTGYGIHIWPDKHYYEGYYNDDKRNGKGIFRWPDGREYRGNYLDDQRNGHGEFIWPNGDRYVGMYQKSNRNGRGCFTWSDGRKYDGEWRDGGYHGVGQYTHRDGSTYVGEWNNNVRHGRGTFQWTDGDIFEGDWVDGRRFGKGIARLRQKDGSVVSYEQTWDEEKFDKHDKGQIPEIAEANMLNPRKRKQGFEGDEDDRSKRVKS